MVQDGRYYLFVTTHGFSFAPGIEAPAGLYGFVSDSPSARGHYLPLNDNGLVLGLEVGELTLPTPNLRQLAKRVPPDGLERAEVRIDGRHRPGRGLTHGFSSGIWCAPGAGTAHHRCPGRHGGGASDRLLTPDRKAGATQLPVAAGVHRPGTATAEPVPLPASQEVVGGSVP